MIKSNAVTLRLVTALTSLAVIGCPLTSYATDGPQNQQHRDKTTQIISAPNSTSQSRPKKAPAPFTERMSMKNDARQKSPVKAKAQPSRPSITPLKPQIIHTLKPQNKGPVILTITGRIHVASYKAQGQSHKALKSL